MAPHAGAPTTPVKILCSNVFERATSGPGQRLGAPPVVDGGWIVRLVARFIGAGYVAYLIVALPEMGHDAAVVSWWWTPLAVAVVFGPGLLLLTASFGAHRYSRIRVAAIAAVVGYGVAAAGWLTAWTGEAVSGTRSTWLVTFSGLVGLCGALVWRPVWVCAVQAVATAGSSVINQLPLAAPQPLWARVGTETVWALGFSGVFVAGVMMAVHTAGVLDATREVVADEAATVAARRARDGERAHVDALVHDRVLATLLEAARTTSPQRLPGQARAALDALDALAAPADAGEGVSAVAVIEHLRGAIVANDGQAPTTVAQTADTSICYPIEAVTALSAAVAEAVRNSVIHAGPTARTRVAIDVSAGRMRVLVSDFGRGFDPDTVAAGRLGIAHSITARMNRVPGGRSAIVSGLGAGTSVELEWTAPSVISSPGPPPAASLADPGRSDIVSRPPRAGWATVFRRAAPRGDASTIIGMQSGWAAAVAAGFLACAAVVTTGSFETGTTIAPALGSLALLAVGVGVVVAAGGDPIHRWPGLLCAAIPALQILVVWPGLPVPLSNPLQTSATVGGGVVVCAFLCARGRVGWAWAGQVLACGVYVSWGIASGQGPHVAIPVFVSNAGVMVMATLFAAILRPAARDIYRLRAEHTARSAERAAAEAARIERARQLQRLDELARPALTLIAERPALTDQHKADVVLLEAQLRDSIRARALDTPEVARAARAARARGVSVALFDDGGLDTASPATTARLHAAAAHHLDAAASGTVTIRIPPPGREQLATIITTSGAETVRHDYDASA